jgi:histidyl-tRNA synthetase
MGEAARESALVLLRDLRRAGLEAHMEYEGRSIKSQMKRADRLKAAFALILGEDELAASAVTVKDMSTGDQARVPRGAVIDHCRALVAGGQE